MSLIPPQPIPRYPDLKREEDWPTLLKCTAVMLERLLTDYAPPTDEQFQAVVHLAQTLAPRHGRRNPNKPFFKPLNSAL